MMRHTPVIPTVNISLPEKGKSISSDLTDETVAPVSTKNGTASAINI